ECFEVALDKSLLFCSRPTFDLPFRCNRIGNPLEPLGKNKRDGPASRCVTAIMTGVVLGHLLLKRNSGCTYVIASVRASQHVKPRALHHWPPSSFETPASRCEAGSSG